MHVQTSAQLQIAAPPEVVFDLVMDARNHPRFMQRLGPIPGVVHAQLSDGATLAPGATRDVRMSDGSSLVEEILTVERPREHRYRWLRPPATPLARMVRGAESTWTFEPRAGATVFTWQYRFELRSILVYPAGMLLIALFKPWMEKALERVRDAAQG
jgi:uncharacterized protein YndB with AHSA1/START domain